MMLNVKQVQKPVQKSADKPEFYIVADSYINSLIALKNYEIEGYVVKGIVCKLSVLLDQIPDDETVLVLEFESTPIPGDICAIARGMIERGTFKQMIFDGEASNGC